MNNNLRLSILIKALNEEAHIGACLDTALREAQAVGGEVILVDSLSTDRTLEIAKNYPVRIVQFERITDRGCGAAVQLGYQYARGEFIYVLDGDMMLEPGFITGALQLLDAQTDLAAVGGKLLDTHSTTAYDTQRIRLASQLIEATEVNELGGGGLYRRSAIESVGYIAHRGLPAYEEAELGFRLRCAGWRLLRQPEVAVRHTGHAETNWKMLQRLWRNGRAQANGMFLRTAWGHPWWQLTARKQWPVFFTPAVHLLCAIISTMLPENLGLWPTRWVLLSSLVWMTIWLVMSARKRDFVLGGFSILCWHYFTVAALIGLGRNITDPNEPILAKEIT